VSEIVVAVVTRMPAMTAGSASVAPVSVIATVGQPDIDAHPEWCSVDPATLAAIGRQIGQQVRIRRSTAEFALYTVAKSHLLEPPGTVRMGPAGMARLGPGDEFAATIDAQGPDPTRSDAAAEAAGELVERLTDGGGRLIAIAPHGGDIEPRTDDQAEQVRVLLAAQRASSWLCRGWRPGGGAVDRWHITSADLAPDCFPQLHTVIRRGFTDAVAFHGSGGSQVLVGGGAASSGLQESIAAAIRLATGLAVRVADPDDRLGGNDPRNVVNRLTAGGANGVQIEQPFAARRDHGPAIVKAVVDVYRAL
jgi:phage replication-related protein YjqB (UPF0714/DUF867 family)